MSWLGASFVLAKTNMIYLMARPSESPEATTQFGPHCKIDLHFVLGNSFTQTLKAGRDKLKLLGVYKTHARLEAGRTLLSVGAILLKKFFIDADVTASFDDDSAVIIAFAYSSFVLRISRKRTEEEDHCQGFHIFKDSAEVAGRSTVALSLG